MAATRGGRRVSGDPVKWARHDLDDADRRLAGLCSHVKIHPGSLAEGGTKRIQTTNLCS